MSAPERDPYTVTLTCGCVVMLRARASSTRAQPKGGYRTMIEPSGGVMQSPCRWHEPDSDAWADQ